MRHALLGFGAGSTPIEISVADYNRLKLAKQRIVQSLAIEDKFDLVIANYEDFEREILELALRQMVYTDLKWASMHRDRQALNRRLVNLLSAGRLYIDQVKHDVSYDQSLIDQIKTKASQQYDLRIGYRVMEALRNYTQHRALPVDHLSMPSSWEPQGEWKHLTFRAVPGITLQTLQEDKTVKPTVLADLEPFGPVVPLTPLIRDYVEGLSVVHQEFRTCTQADIAVSEASFDWAWQRCRSISDSDGKAVRIVEFNSRGNWSDEDHIFEELISRRRDLSAKNQPLVNLARRYVSGACQLKEN
jgi:hypothetical protein